MLNVLITGGTGFLGMHLIEDLHKEYNLSFIGRNKELGEILERQDNVTFIQGDLTCIDEIESAFKNIDIVIHAAAKSELWGQYDDFYQNNVVATKNVLELSLKHKVKRFVHVSSPSIYYDGSDRLNIKEEDYIPKKSVNHYAETKRIAENIVLSYQEKGLEVIGIRPRGIFGEFDSSIIPRILDMAEQKSIPLIRKGEAVIDVTYVKNVVHAIKLCMECEKENLGEFYNITNGEPLTIKDLMDRLFLVLNKKVKYNVLGYKLIMFIVSVKELIAKIKDKEPDFTRYSLGLICKHQTLSIEKAKIKLGYEPIYSIDEGLERYADWKKLMSDF